MYVLDRQPIVEWRAHHFQGDDTNGAALCSADELSDEAAEQARASPHLLTHLHAGERREVRAPWPNVSARLTSECVGKHGTWSLGQRQWHVTANKASDTGSYSGAWRFDTHQDTPPSAFRV